MFGEAGCETGRIVVVWVEGESPKVVAGSGGVKVVEQEYLPILLALDKREPVVRQKQVIVGHIVSNFQLGVYQDCWFTTQLILSSH